MYQGQGQPAHPDQLQTARISPTGKKQPALPAGNCPAQAAERSNLPLNGQPTYGRLLTCTAPHLPRKAARCGERTTSRYPCGSAVQVSLSGERSQRCHYFGQIFFQMLLPCSKPVVRWISSGCVYTLDTLIVFSFLCDAARKSPFEPYPLNEKVWDPNYKTVNSAGRDFLSFSCTIQST